MALPIPNPRREIPLVSLTPKLCASNTNARSIGTSGWSKRAASSVADQLNEVQAHARRQRRELFSHVQQAEVLPRHLGLY
jgi:hypothetical protein